MNLNLRRAVAFALMGWYLMSAGSDPNSSPPLSSWTIVGSFDLAAECEAKLRVDAQYVVQDLKARHRDKIPAAHLNAHDDGWDLTLLNEVCVSTDDPRLKEN